MFLRFAAASGVTVAMLAGAKGVQMVRAVVGRGERGMEGR